jgi:hypothetical protein
MILMRLTTPFTIAALLMFAGAGVASAQTAAPATTPAKPAAMAPAKPAKATTKKASPVERSAKSKECSTQADAKGLHGKARKTFRSKCKAGKS